MSEIYIENYSENSFIVRGDTIKFKDNLRIFGGKWNSRLTDKKTGEKFGAWIFYKSKKEEIQKWIQDGCKSDCQPSSGIIPKPINNFNKEIESKSVSVSVEHIKNLENKIDQLSDTVKYLCKIIENLKSTDNEKTENKKTEIIVFEDPDEPINLKPKRLLK